MQFVDALALERKARGGSGPYKHPDPEYIKEREAQSRYPSETDPSYSKRYVRDYQKRDRARQMRKRRGGR